MYVGTILSHNCIVRNSQYKDCTKTCRIVRKFCISNSGLQL